MGVLGDLSAIAVCHDFAVVAAASGVFNVISHRQGQLIRYQLLFQQIQRDGFRHFPHHQPCFLKGIWALQNLPGADAVRFRPVCLDILHTARLPAPCVVDEEFSVDAEHPIEQFFIVVFVRLADGASCNIPHGVDADGFQLFCITVPNAPEICQRAVRPKLLTVAHFVKLRNADAIFVRLDVLCHNVHSDLAEIEVAADACRGCDARGVQDVRDHNLCQLTGGHVVSLQIARHIHHHLVDGIDMDVLRGDVFQVYVVDLGADLNVFCHPRRGNEIIYLSGWVSRQFIGVEALFGKAASFAPLFRVDFLDTLHHFKKPCSAGDAVCL